MNRRRTAALVATLLALACAKMGPPPGGPPDQLPPELRTTRPDSVRVLPDFRGEVEFAFTEVVSEGTSPNFGLGTGTLESLVLLSPDSQVPVVRWRRDRITVRPRGGWRPGVVYRVELLPGVTDLQSNRMEAGAVVTFTTGAPAPTTTLHGRVVDWTSRRPQPEAVVEALLLPDSLPYRALTDSLGYFALGPLPAGEYLVSGGIDQNRSRRLDSRELFDSIRVAAGRDTVGEIWAFRHDSTGPRIQTVAFRDSVSITVTLNQPVDPRRPLDETMARILALPDSAPLRVAGVYLPEVYDSLFPARSASPLTPEDSVRADSLRAVEARRDSLVADSLAQAERREAERAAEDARRGIVRRSTVDRPPRPLEPLTSRPPLGDRVLVRLDSTLAPGGRYVVQVRGIPNPSGASTESLLVLVVPARDTTALRPDTAAVRPDTGAAGPAPLRSTQDRSRPRR